MGLWAEWIEYHYSAAFCVSLGIPLPRESELDELEGESIGERRRVKRS